MKHAEGVDRFRARRGEFRPWTSAGEPDPDHDDATRAANQWRLTDPELVGAFRRRFPKHGAASYDEMVRLLGYIWDCPHDATANVTGHRCATCRRTRVAALRASAGLAN
jgi:hypothetical protein